MVDNVNNLAQVQDRIVTDTQEFNSNSEDDRRQAKIERKLENLLNQRGTINPDAAASLMNEAAALHRMADYTKHLADIIERNENQVQKKKLEEIKALLMEKLGVPAAFVEQLSILVKAGPEALREASGVYRKEAMKKREQAALVYQEVERIDGEIQKLSTIKEYLKVKDGNLSESMSDFINRKLYEEAVRENAELELKKALELIQGSQTENLANKV